MLTAHQLHMTDGQYVYVVAHQVPPQNVNTPWVAGNEQDETARLAFQSVLQVRVDRFKQTQRLTSTMIVYMDKISSVCTVCVKKSSPDVFLYCFPNGWESLLQILHAYYTYARQQIFVQLPETLTKLCHIKRDHPCSRHVPKRNVRWVVALNMA